MSGREFAPRLQIIGGGLVVSLDVHRAIFWSRDEYWSPEVGMLAWEKHWVLESSEIVKRVRVAYYVERWGGRNEKLSERFLGWRWVRILVRWMVELWIFCGVCY